MHSTAMACVHAHHARLQCWRKSCRSSFKVLDMRVKYWEDIVWSDQMIPKLNSLDVIIHALFGVQMAQHIIPKWCGTGKIHIMEGRMNGKIYRDILDKNLQPSTRMMKMKRG